MFFFYFFMKSLGTLPQSFRKKLFKLLFHLFFNQRLIRNYFSDFLIISITLLPTTLAWNPHYKLSVIVTFSHCKRKNMKRLAAFRMRFLFSNTVYYMQASLAIHGDYNHDDLDPRIPKLLKLKFMIFPSIFAVCPRFSSVKSANYEKSANNEDRLFIFRNVTWG